MKYIESIENFIHKENLFQQSEYSWLLVNFSGLQKMTMTLASGEQLFSVTGNKVFTALVPKGSHCDFSYEEDRNNWVIKLKDGVIAESATGKIEVKWDDFTCELPGFSTLNIIQSEKLKEYLMRLLRAFHSPGGEHSVSSSLIFSAILDCVVDAMLNPTHTEDPATSLRNMIISDRSFVRNLSDLSSVCGYSPDHIRGLFVAQFGITPKAFRTNYRMSIAREMLSQGSLSIQEVSDNLGYSHSAHFSTAFKKYFGYPPRDV